MSDTLSPEIRPEPDTDWLTDRRAGADIVGGVRIERRRTTPQSGWYAIGRIAAGPFQSAWGARAWAAARRGARP